MKLTIADKLPSLSRVKPAERSSIKVALVQMHWQADAAAHKANLFRAIETAAKAGAQVVCLPELTLSRYMADQMPTGTPNELAEDLETGPTLEFARLAAIENKVFVHASLFAKSNRADGRGLNIAIMVDTLGTLIAKTPKLHIPVTAGYYEDQYFAAGPNALESNGQNPYPIIDVNYQADQPPAKFGLPTCWDEWFGEVTRAYSLAGGEVLVYPTAIGSEPDHPSFDTAPLWQHVIVGNGIANGTFMVVPNRWGNEGTLNFYGSSFISDPYGRILAQASRDQDEVLVAELDLDQRRDWLDLFPFLATRRPDTYGTLSAPVANPRLTGGPMIGDGIEGGIAGVVRS
jgi:N-carbamoylputrescine amidase